jgi:hypothetical protein
MIGCGGAFVPRGNGNVADGKKKKKRVSEKTEHESVRTRRSEGAVETGRIEKKKPKEEK